MASAQIVAPSKIKIVENFNHTLKLLICDLAKRYPSDAIVARAKKRAILVILVKPMHAIKKVGAYLYNYRDQIYNFNDSAVDFFLSNTFENEVRSSDPDKVDMISYIIPKAKECARSLPPAEMEVYKGLIVSLLDDYIEYLSISLNHSN